MFFQQKDVKFAVSEDGNTPYFYRIKVLFEKFQLYLNGSQITT